MPSPLADIPAALGRFGPDRCETVDLPTARAWCRALAWGGRENFSVLTGLVPPQLRDDFASIYAFCRWADDLGDEFGADRERARGLLAWWRGELEACAAGTPRHPVMVALAPTIAAHELPLELFDRLIRAFELDQTKARYGTWDELLDYCRDSADPVGRLVLMILGEPRSEELFRLSDRICTALQLTNHWQDLRRDLDQRDRIYVPAELVTVPDFERRFRATVALGHSVDPTFFAESRELVRSLVERTWPLYAEGAALIDRIAPASRPVIWLFLAGGERTLRQIELWNHETVLHRPYLSKATKLGLVARAWLMAFRARRGTAVDARPMAGGLAGKGETAA
jgi:squalene synthase HpnC